MKSHDEMYQSLLSRYDDYQKKKKQRIIITRRIVSLAACFTVIFSGYQIWNNISKNPLKPPVIDEVSDINGETNTDFTETATINSGTTYSKQKDVTVTTKTQQTNTETSMSTTYTESQQTETHPLTTQTEYIQPSSELQTTPVNTTQSVIQTQTVTETTTITTFNPDIHEVKFGYIEEGQDTGKPSSPTSSNIIVMKCMSFCNTDEKLNVEVMMADKTLNPKHYDSARNYEYEVYACNTLYFENIDDKRFIVNGEQSEYKRVYSNDEIKLFDITGNYDNYDLYHHELTEIDFSNYESGDVGCILFSFKVAYMDDPLNPSYMGSNQRMYFYVGEKGTAVSSISIDVAMENYLCAVG